MYLLIFHSFIETLIMISLSSLIGVFLGSPLGILLFNSGPGGLSECRKLNQILSLIVNSIRSIPFIILIVLLIPLTRLITGSSIGTLSAVVPLGFTTTFLVARVIEDSLRELPKGLIEAGIAMGASRHQIIVKILIPEAMAKIISGLTLIIVSIVGFSAMAGAVGGGGLGDLAIRYGYQRFNLEVLIVVVLILIALVQLIQFIGDQLSSRLRKNRG